ncbi:MAG TPA: chemotaxis protein CheB [Agitococcus sp.]|nr:chemotaxis protein CheB [Agitococcus sp.]HMV59640.1 chemotaxis protein CheB [Agitococcus sp.]HMX98474.1 chemotaxis protein CheB [Agitococcus sp.]HMY27491.1 chemotaxis protein CheB [Agitococcus sp.]HMY81330.1 chemotaxis protein CheB [Agitococcus sp.]
MAKRNPKVAIVSDISLQRLALAHAVKGQGYDLVLNSSPERLDDRLFKSVEPDVWIVDLQNEDDELLDRILDLGVPVLFGLDAAPAQGTRQYPRWERRVFIKLYDVVGHPVIQENLEPLEKQAVAPVAPREIYVPQELMTYKSQRLEFVCVLAASLGGPAAVKEFLDFIPSGLPVAFVLAQHIDARMQESLTRVLVRHNHMPCHIAHDGDKLKSGQLLIAPVETEIDFSADGQVISRNIKWDGPYSPSIDQVLANVGRRFGKKSIAIIFSGMGSDGSISGPQMVEAGGSVWAQDEKTCACPSQPDAMRATGCVSFSGTPFDLANRLVMHISRNLSAHTA